MSHYFENDNNLISEIRELIYKYSSFSFTFYSDNGVFSKNAIDYGSKLLLETYLEDEKESKKVLDVGCGYGFIGIVISIISVIAGLAVIFALLFAFGCYQNR